MPGAVQYPGLTQPLTVAASGGGGLPPGGGGGGNPPGGGGGGGGGGRPKPPPGGGKFRGQGTFLGADIVAQMAAGQGSLAFVPIVGEGTSGEEPTWMQQPVTPRTATIGAGVLPRRAFYYQSDLVAIGANPPFAETIPDRRQLDVELRSRLTRAQSISSGTSAAPGLRSGTSRSGSLKEGGE